LSRGQIPNRLHYDIINKPYTLLAYDSDVKLIDEPLKKYCYVMFNRTTKGQTLLPSGNSLDKSSSIKPELEKHKVDDVVTVDKKHRDNNNDIQGPEDRNSNCYNNAKTMSR
jgi:hypothetical protein